MILEPGQGGVVGGTGTRTGWVILEPGQGGVVGDTGTRTGWSGG